MPSPNFSVYIEYAPLLMADNIFILIIFYYCVTFDWLYKIG